MSFNLISVANAATKGTSAWEGAGCASDGVATIKGLECLIGNILEPLPALITFAAVAMLIMAGFKIMNAGADPKAYASGWSTFSYAIVGIILLSVVWLVLVIVQKYTGADILNFGIKP